MPGNAEPRASSVDAASIQARRRVMQELTCRPLHHHLTNTNVWSHDGQWIYYDVRSDPLGAVFDGPQIERVNVRTREVEVIYRSSDNACVGVVTASPTDNRIAFIHGPEHPTEAWSYAAYHRRGVVMRPGESGLPSNLDARNVVAPYTAGALRGGSHVHVWDRRGEWVSFTYEDHVLATSAGGTQTNQRNIGVSIPAPSVVVPKSHPRNHDGTHFSVVATRTHDQPTPGSDQIAKAYEDAWVGSDGYLNHLGTRQSKALAFIGDVAGDDSNEWIPELYLVDLPGDLTVEGEGPLAGTASTRPFPPAGAMQRRLTRTTHRKHPGLATDVRHWPRSRPDGTEIFCLMRDDEGVIQLCGVSTANGSLRQITYGSESVASAFTVHPSGQFVACVIGDEVCEVTLDGGVSRCLARQDADQRFLPFAVVYSPDGKMVAFGAAAKHGEDWWNQVYVVARE
ncbi:DUF3748 domain-containing protein [Rhodopirellula halodulae]|nr:DUF3748 domain-containing protein [Rhodopirellula sp. JC740]